MFSFLSSERSQQGPSLRIHLRNAKESRSCRLRLDFARTRFSTSGQPGKKGPSSIRATLLVSQSFTSACGVIVSAAASYFTNTVNP